MNQSELEVNTCGLLQAQENVYKQVTISFGFVSYCLSRKVAQVLLTNHRVQYSKTKANVKLLSTQMKSPYCWLIPIVKIWFAIMAEVWD